MRIVLLGATGLVGNHLLAQLISADSNHQILTLGRTQPDVPSKLQEAFNQRVTFSETDLANDDELSQIISNFQEQADVDMLICCLGTTIRQAGSRQAFFHVDHDLVLTPAKAAKRCGIDRMMLVSAINASDQSNVFYSKVKGQVEQSLKLLNFDQLIIIKPSLLMGQRKTFRLAESLFAPIVKLINPLLQGVLKKYRGVEGEAVAECMIKQLINPKQGVLEVFPTDYL
jgi:uncharacterized protein YbjT (DUF2867 family)